MQIFSYYQKIPTLIKLLTAISILLILFIATFFIRQGQEEANKSFICGQDRIIDNRDGNFYNTIKIGDLCWMAENLRYLPSVSPSSTGSETEPIYYVYDYQGVDLEGAKATTNFKTHGVLYNWSAAMQACPAGTRLPTDSEWHLLESEFATDSCSADRIGPDCAPSGARIKSTYPWWDGNNESGFAALPSGIRFAGGSFGTLDVYAWFWSATESDAIAWSRFLFSPGEIIGRLGHKKSYGLSVRCIQHSIEVEPQNLNN